MYTVHTLSLCILPVPWYGIQQAVDDPNFGLSTLCGHRLICAQGSS